MFGPIGLRRDVGGAGLDGGIGAGIDSYYEYLFKAYVLLNDPFYLSMFAVVSDFML